MAGWNEQWFRWRGGRLHYREAARGVPVVLLHGGAADSAWRSWEDAPKFLPDLRLLAPDFPGFGKSDLKADRVDVGLDAQEPPGSLFAELTHTINPQQRGASGGSSTAGLFQKDFRRRLVWIAIDALFQLPSCASGWGVVSSDEQSLDMDQQEMQNGR